MRKTDKKIDKAIVAVLTESCEIAKDEYDGFQWLTHFVNYNNFPSSLRVLCVFDTNEQLERVDMQAIHALIQSGLEAIDINFAKASLQLSFDTEENCMRENKGDWDKRIG